jgi:hypothetical protein
MTAIGILARDRSVITFAFCKMQDGAHDAPSFCISGEFPAAFVTIEQT